MISFLALTAWMATAGASPTLTLEQALDEARQKNLDLAVARARLEQAQTTAKKAWANYLPTVAVGANYTRNSNESRVTLPGGPTIVIQPYNALGAQAQLRQAIIAPSLWPAIEAAYKVERVAELNTEQAKRDILFGVAQAYYAAAAAQAAINAQERLYEVNQARVKDTQARFDAGTVTRVALMRAQVDETRAEQDLVSARNVLASAKLSLATLLVRDSADFELESPPEPSMPSQEGDLVQVALQQRADVAAARESVNLALTNRRTVLFSYLPSLGLTANYSITNSAGFAGTNKVWTITLGANWTLWDGGLREANMREQSARIAEANAQQHLSELRAREEVERAQLDLETNIGNRTRAEKALELARETQRLTELSFRAGVATYLEVSDANASLTSAEVGFVSARLNAALAALRLLRSAGRFGLEPTIAQVQPPQK